MMQAGVCLRQDTETTLPELTEQHRIRLKEEELSGLESETECAAPGLNTLGPECVTAHSGVSDVHHSHASVIKREADLGSTHTGDLTKTESLDFTEMGYVTHLHPDKIKTETEDGGYLQAEHISDLQDIKCVDIKSDELKCESSESLVSELMNTVMTGAGVDHTDQTERECAGEKSPNCKKEEIHDQLNQYGDINNHCHTLHTGEKPYKCSQCGKCFSRRYHLNNHLRIHTGEKPYECSECGKCFITKSGLSTHRRIHNVAKPYKCSECGKCFVTKSGLNTHLRIHNVAKPYKCSECGQCFSRRHHLNGHQLSHTSKMPYKCYQCEKCFRFKYGLTSHLRIHTSEKHYKCSQCAKCFSTRYRLNSHQRLHTGEKPYECSECGKCFITKSGLSTHLRIHTVGRPYKCSQCGKCLTTIAHLNDHQRIHTGEKPYKCLQCGKCFRFISALTIHLRIHTGESPINVSLWEMLFC